ncbi:MAG TPA: MFS transporter [Thermodesulfobacteriota bacterium]
MRLLRALDSRNYRLFFAGQGISLIGGFMTRVASAWLVYRLTDSPFLLGFVSFASTIPTFVLGPLVGPLVDRSNRVALVVGAKVLSMLVSLALAALAFSGAIEVWHIVALNLCQGLVDVVEVPARQSLVVDLVERRDDLPNAIALNSSLFNAARLVGPSIGGLVIAAAGEAACFLADALSYLAIIAALRAMRLPPRPPRASIVPFGRQLREGLGYALGSSPIRAVLLLLSLTSLAGMPYVTLAPVMARDVLGGGPETLGFLMASIGIGALGGTMFLAARTSVRGFGTIIAAAAAVFGMAAGVFALSQVFWLSSLALAVAGAGMIVHSAAANTVLQTLVGDEMRGRIMSLYAVAVIGMMPFGSLGAGALASQVGAPTTILAGGLLCLVGSALFARQLPALRTAVRPAWARPAAGVPVAGGRD